MTICNQKFKISCREQLMGVSILMIFIYHLILFYERYTGVGLPVIDEITGKGYIGVDIFMFLSAYGLCFSLEKNGLKCFYFHRIIRLYPMYVFFTGLLFLVLYAFTDLLLSISEIIRISLLQFSGLAVVLHFNCEIEWFMPALIVLYICFPLLFKLVNITLNRYGSRGELFLIIISIFGGVILKNYIYENFAFRLPIIVTAIIFYFRRDFLEHLFKLSLFCLICSVMTCRPLLESSMIIPILMVVVSFLDVCSLKLDSILRFIGAHTLEIYLAQVITTKYILSFRWTDNILIEYMVVTVLTILFAIILYYTHFYSIKVLCWKKRVNNHTNT